LNRDAVERRHVAVADEHILMDMDGPRQYEALVEALIDYEVPSASERTALLTEKLRIPESVAVHSRKVADIALRVSQALNDQGRRLNTKLVESVGLLGNSAIRSRSAVVSELLKEMGCPAVSRIVGNPTDMISDGQGAITVEEIVCFADAIVQPYTTVSVEQTQPVGITPCEVVSGPAESLETRLAIVSGIRRRLEKELGAPIETVINPAIMDL
jgi:hypothetical protein